MSRIFSADFLLSLVFSTSTALRVVHGTDRALNFVDHSHRRASSEPTPQDTERCMWHEKCSVYWQWT